MWVGLQLSEQHDLRNARSEGSWSPRLSRHGLWEHQPDHPPSSRKETAVATKFRPQSHPHLFSRARKIGFSFFACGATPSRTVPNTQPMQVAFSLRERVDLRSKKEGIWGKKITWGRVGRTGQKKEKGMHKKRWAPRKFTLSIFCPFPEGERGVTKFQDFGPFSRYVPRNNWRKGEM